MTDFTKIKTKRKKGLGVPPSVDQIKGNLEKPELAPSVDTKNKVGRPKTNRTAKITTTLTPEFKERLQILSIKTGKTMGEIIEEAVLLWEDK